MEIAIQFPVGIDSSGRLNFVELLDEIANDIGCDSFCGKPGRLGFEKRSHGVDLSQLSSAKGEHDSSAISSQLDQSESLQFQ
jgi:hypothetical protein